MSETTLKPCPFCGDAEPFVERADFSSAFVQCNNCIARGPTCCQESDEEETPGEMAAIKEWNTRAPDPLIAKQQRMIEMAREAFNRIQEFTDDPYAAGTADEALAAISETEKEGSDVPHP